PSRFEDPIVKRNETAKRRSGETGPSPIRPLAESPIHPILIGAHMAIARGVNMAIGRARSIRCTAMQIFVKNDMQWLSRPLTPDALRPVLEHQQRSDVLPIFAPAHYLPNHAGTD